MLSVDLYTDASANADGTDADDSDTGDSDTGDSERWLVGRTRLDGKLDSRTRF